MLKIINLLLLLFAVCSIAGCSYITSFVISNESDGNLLISYTFETCETRTLAFWACPSPSDDSCPQLIEDIIPAIHPVKGSKRLSQADWKNLERSEFSYDTGTCTLKISLQPKMALRIALDLNYTGPDDIIATIKAIKRLTLTSENESFSLGKAEIVKRFTKVSRILYVMRYPSLR